MGMRRWRLRSPRLERVAFVLLLGVAAALVLASTQIADDPPAFTQPPELAETLSSGPLTAIVADSGIVPATTEAGRRRDRIRVVLVVELRSSSGREVSARRALRLQYSGRTIRPDLKADEAGVLDLNDPLPPRGSRRGEVRFELAGRDTRVLRDRGEADVVLIAPEGRRDSVPIEFDVPA